MSPAMRPRELSHDRRSHCRYPLSTDLKYSLTSSGGCVQVGSGRTINLSSGGVIFEADVALPLNVSIELSIPWPARNRPQIQLELHVTGETVRVEDRQVAVKFDHSIFRTAKP